MQQPNPKPKKTLDTLLQETKTSFSGEFAQKKWVARARGYLADSRQFIAKLQTIGNVAKNNYALAQKHYALGNFSDAIWRLNLVVLLDPNHADAWLLLGKSYLATHKKPLARKMLAKALALKPNWPEATEALATAQSAPHVA